MHNLGTDHKRGLDLRRVDGSRKMCYTTGLLGTKNIKGQIFKKGQILTTKKAKYWPNLQGKLAQRTLQNTFH